VRKGYAESVQDCFKKYLSVGCYAYSNKQALMPDEAVSLIREAGGIAVAAHLHLIKMEDEPLKKFLADLIPHGLDGVEGYYTDYTPDMEVRYRAMAKELGLAYSPIMVLAVGKGIELPVESKKG
jgi:predicted metal-dependent phosphoesterase TrpH